MPHIEMKSIESFYAWMKSEEKTLNEVGDRFDYLNGKQNMLIVIIDEYESRFQWLKERDI